MKGVLWRVANLFVQQVEIPTEEAHNALVGYLIAKYKRSRMYDRLFGCTEFISTRPGRIDKAVKLTYMEPGAKKKMAKRILGEYPDEYLKMLELIDRFRELPETPAHFQERCGQAALMCFWNETHGVDAIENGPMPREIVPSKQEASETVTDGDFMSVS